MSNRLAFQTQLASIMEVLANAAVAEICKLVDDDYAVMTLQMSQCQRENKALKRKLHLLELRMARGFAERRIRESSLNRSSRVQVTASLPDKYRDFSREAVLVKAETSDEGNKQPELFIREDVAEPIPEGGEAGYGAAQLEKADGHHSRTRRQALEFVESSTDICRSGTSSSPAQITIALGAEESQPSCSYVVDADQDQDCVLVQPAALSGIDGGSSNRLQEARGPIAVDEEWTTAAISQQTQQLSHYSRTDGVRLEQSNRVNVSQTVSKVTMNSQMLTSFSQAGYSLAGLQMPKRLEKGKRKSYICKYCGKAFTGLSNVEAHQRVHTGEKPFKCETCGKLFAEAGNLKKHQRVHTGEKPFTCTRCGKRFAWICNLRTHQQSASCGGV
uniref:Si:ch211-89o9.6 n=1 Tax=Astyanax mexicanus TaxID=7994 RepID=A0A3B1IME4_ASTMX